jgi:hypothetical protein
MLAAVLLVQQLLPVAQAGNLISLFTVLIRTNALTNTNPGSSFKGERTAQSFHTEFTFKATTIVYEQHSKGFKEEGVLWEYIVGDVEEPMVRWT